MIARLRARKVWNEAASWFARMQEPSSQAEVAAFEAWLARDRSHARAYAEMGAVAGAAGNVAPSLRRPARSHSIALRPALALLVAGVILATTVALLQGTASPAFAAISNTGAAVRGVRLQDGTVVWLDTGAAIAVRLVEPHREIAVRQGRARILPGHDVRPLEVHAGTWRISPGQTKLDVEVAGDRITIGALDGPLMIVSPSNANDPDATLRVDAGRALAIDSDGASTRTVDRTWPAGRLRFADAPLSQILVLANRHADPDIVAGDPTIAALRVTGVFDLRDTPSLARKLAATLDLRVDAEGTQLMLRR